MDEKEMMDAILGVGREVIIYTNNRETVKMRHDGPSAFTATKVVGDEKDSVTFVGHGATRGSALARMHNSMLEQCRESFEFRKRLFELKTGRPYPSADEAKAMIAAKGKK